MSGKDQSFVDQLLYGEESIAEVFGILYARHFIAYFTQRLCKGGTAQFQLVEAEVYVVKGGLCIVHKYGRYHFLHVGNFTAGRYDDRTRSNDFASVGIFLGHRQRVLTGGNIDLQCAAEVAQCFDCLIETCVFTFLRTARPHPVGGQGYTVQAFCKRSPYQVGQCFADGEDRTGCRVGKCRLRGMSQRSCNTFFAAIVQCNDATIAQR